MPHGRQDRSTITFRFLAAPTDAGQSGAVSAGKVLEWIDKAGYALAVQWSGRYCVTAYVGNVRFSRPIEVGHLVEVVARIVRTGRSSMDIMVETYSGDPTTGERCEATHCLMVFVAMDEAGKSTPVAPFTPGGEAERVLEQWAVRRSKVRAEIQQAMRGQEYTDAGTAPRLTLRFLAAPTDRNWGGKVHGGFVMKWIDEAAHVLVTQWSGNSSNAAIFTGGVRFYSPMHIGDLVEVEARLLHTGRTSVHIGVQVHSSDPALGDRRLTTFCRTIFVALDEDRRALPTPTWVPVTDEDKALDAHAMDLIAIRARHEETADLA